MDTHANKHKKAASPSNLDPAAQSQNPKETNKKPMNDQTNTDPTTGTVEELIQNEQETSEAAPIETPDELTELHKKLAELEDNHLRTLADYDNYRKRMQKDRLEWRQNYHLEIIEEILPVLDNFDLALKSIPDSKDVKQFSDGIILVDKQLHDILTQHNLREIEALGKPFDPHLHEAMQIIDNADYPEHTVIEEIRKGYLFGERVIRPSLVKVSKLPVSDIVDEPSE